MIEADVVDSKGQEKRSFDEKYRQELINKMTNNERNHWARAGYPQKCEQDILQFIKHNIL